MLKPPSNTVCMRLALALCLMATAQACQHVRAEPAAALGVAAPDFVLSDTDGIPVELKSLRGKIVVLEWFNPECPFVKYAHGKGPLHDLAKRQSSEKLEWLTINSNAPGKQGNGIEVNRAGKRDFGMTNRLLLDDTGKVGQAYGAIKTPHVFIVDAKGILVYRGGLDNAPIGVVDDDRPHASGHARGKYEPYVEQALSDLAQRKRPRLADTPPYGCTVKYAD